MFKLNILCMLVTCGKVVNPSLVLTRRYLHDEQYSCTVICVPAAGNYGGGVVRLFSQYGERTIK